MVNDQINGNEWFDEFRVFAESGDGRAHGGEVNEQGDAREILKHDARDDERDLFGALGPGAPVGERSDVLLADLFAVVIPQHGFEDDADAHGQL